MSDSRFTDLEGWLAALARPGALMELGALALCGGVAWAVAALMRRSVGSDDKTSILFGRRIVDGVLFPALLLCLAYVARAWMVGRVTPAVFKIAIPVLLSLLVIRLGVKVLQAAFRDAPLVRALERTISWVAWLAMVLWVSGLLPVLLDELDQITWKVGDSMLSVRTLRGRGADGGRRVALHPVDFFGHRGPPAALRHRRRAVLAQGGQQRHACVADADRCAAGAVDGGH